VKRFAVVLVAAAAASACSSSGSGGSIRDASTDATGPSKDAASPVDGAPQDSSADGSAADAAADVEISEEAGGCAWNGSVESPACTSCLRSMCCDVTAACENDPSCVALDSCVNACDADEGGDAGSVPDCDEACADQQTQAVRNEYQAWTQCIDTLCGAGNESGPCL
jgi:hypothetical protein